MNRHEALKNSSESELYSQIIKLHKDLDDAFLLKYERSLPFNETFFDRWERAKKLGFGEKTSIYDSAMVLGKVQVGKNCWIGPYSIIDGSGGLQIGDYCTISAGVHIYSHDNVMQTLSSGIIPIEREKVLIGNNVYIGPNAIIVKGVEIGNFCVIGASSFINKNVPDKSIVVGQPGRHVGKVELKDGVPVFEYFK